MIGTITKTVQEIVLEAVSKLRLEMKTLLVQGCTQFTNEQASDSQQEARISNDGDISGEGIA